MKTYLVIITVSLFMLSSCCAEAKKKTDYKLTPTFIQSWLPFKYGDKMYFTDGSTIDSMSVVLYENHGTTIGTECRLDVGRINVYVQGAKVSLQIVLLYKEVIFRISSHPIGDSFCLKKDIYATENGRCNLNKQVVQLNDVSYNDVLVIDNDSVQIYYREKDGIIGYKVNDVVFMKTENI